MFPFSFLVKSNTMEEIDRSIDYSLSMRSKYSRMPSSGCLPSKPTVDFGALISRNSATICRFSHPSLLFCRPVSLRGLFLDSTNVRKRPFFDRHHALATHIISSSSVPLSRTRTGATFPTHRLPVFSSLPFFLFSLSLCE